MARNENQIKTGMDHMVPINVNTLRYFFPKRIGCLSLLLAIFFVFGPRTACAENPGYREFKAARYRLLDQALATVYHTLKTA